MNNNETLKKAVDRVQGSADSWVMGVSATQVEVPPERRFIGFDAYQKAMDCLSAGDVVIFATPDGSLPGMNSLTILRLSRPRLTS